MITESYVVGSGKAVGVWGIEANCASIVDCAWASTDIVDPVTTISDHGVLCRARGEWVVDNRLANEGKLNIGCRQPVQELGLTDNR